MKNIIFDTDIGGDSDDITALDVLISAHKNGECNLIGVTYSVHNKYGAGCIRAILRQHGVPEIPVGSRPYTEGCEGGYAQPVAELYPDTALTETENAVSLMRRLLVQYGEVTIVATGSIYNLAMLLKTGADGYSPLDGVSLVREKVCEFAVMAGNFSHQDCFAPLDGAIAEDGTVLPVPECNVNLDAAESCYFFENCPVQCVLIPWEVGIDVITAKPVIDIGGRNNPDSLGYITAGHINGSQGWDPITAFYAVYGAKPYLYLSSPGRIVCYTDEKAGLRLGIKEWQTVTDFVPCSDGLYRVAFNSVPKKELAEIINIRIMRLFH